MKTFFKIILTGIFIFGFNESNNVFAPDSLEIKVNDIIKITLKKYFISMI